MSRKCRSPNEVSFEKSAHVENMPDFIGLESRKSLSFRKCHRLIELFCAEQQTSTI